MYIIAILVTLFISNGFAKGSKLEPLAGFYLVNGCQIFNFKGEKLRVFPGAMCLFRPDDGMVVSASENSLRMFNPKMEIVWEIPGKFHHQLQLTKDSTKILTLAWDTVTRENISYRVDKFMVIDFSTGKILASARADELLQGHVKFLGESTIKSPQELTHFNSISDIPTQDKGSNKLSYIEKGNIVVNSLGQGTCFLSHDLKEVKKCISFKRSCRDNVHDVSVTSRGNILYFNNQVMGTTCVNSSAVQIIHPETQNLIYEWSASPREVFYSPCCGSAQQLGPIFIITHMSSGTYIVRRNDNKLLAYIPETHFDGWRMTPSQQVKAMYLGDLLKLWE